MSKAEPDLRPGHMSNKEAGALACDLGEEAFLACCLLINLPVTGLDWYQTGWEVGSTLGSVSYRPVNI
jgi:hypothetical protein